MGLSRETEGEDRTTRPAATTLVAGFSNRVECQFHISRSELYFLLFITRPLPHPPRVHVSFLESGRGNDLRFSPTIVESLYSLFLFIYLVPPRLDYLFVYLQAMSFNFFF